MLAIFFIAFTFIDYGEAKGQCPPGYTSTTFTYTDDDMGCDVTVEYCYMFLYGNMISQLQSAQIHYPCSNTFEYYAFKRNLDTAMLEHGHTLQAYQPCDGPISSRTVVQFKNATCAKHGNLTDSPPGLPGMQLVYYIEYCLDAGYCVNNYYACYNPATGNIEIELYGQSTEGTSCETEYNPAHIPPAPWYGNPIGWNYTWETECLFIECEE